MNSFKTQLLALVSGLILMFIIIIFLIFRGIDKTRQDLIQVNKIYLAQITLKLDLTLWEDSFSSILEKNLFSKYEKGKKTGFLTVYFIKLLEGEFTDFPGVDFGYYDKELETILGCPPPLGPPLPQNNQDNESTWTSIETGLKADAVKKLSEEITMGEEDIFISEKLGNKFFLFYIHPLVRRGNLIGTTWAIMEFRDFYEPFMVNIRIAFIVMIAGILAALAAGNRLRKGFEYIQDGLQKLKVDLGYRFEKRGGEIGEISNAINELASTLSKVRSYTELILEGTGEGVIALDKDSKVVFFNKSAGILLNINRENVIEKDYREIVTEEKDLLRETIEDSLAGKNRNILKSVYR